MNCEIGICGGLCVPARGLPLGIVLTCGVLVRGEIHLCVIYVTLEGPNVNDHALALRKGK